MRLTAEQIKEARRLLGWTQLKLRLAANISTGTIVNVELGQGNPSQATIAKVRSALEAAGVEFIPENVGGAGVRLRKGNLTP